MIRCLAIDDEPLALKKLATYIKKIPFLELADTCQSAQEALEPINNNMVDAIFVDINMPDLNGLEFVKTLQDPPIVVFTTAYSEYAVEGYKVNAIGYLLKPFSLEEFKEVAEKVKNQYDLIKTASVSTADADDTIFLKTEYKIIRISLSEISHIEAMSEYLRIFLDGKTRPIVVLLSMKKMEERLPSSTFMRVHRSYIINLKKIREVSRNHIFLTNDADIPVGDLYKDAFNAYIASKFLSK
ncbi:MAG: response regulator transcription factor [Muribaculaceae bacterium]|nr:response regulator transcription factor [Muribaculaceae bacterium]